jgi:rod shape-determining protein MreC
VLDRRLGYLNEFQRRTHVLVQPIWALAALPSKTRHGVQRYFGDRYALENANLKLREQLLIKETELLRLKADLASRQRVEKLIGNTEIGSLGGQLARVIDVDLDRYSNQIAIDRGASEGISNGWILLDEGGVMGQVVRTFSHDAIAILISDARHRLPVQVQRNGLRLYLEGNGRADQLELGGLTATADVKLDDVLLTSGMGGIFPAGLPVGHVKKISFGSDSNFLDVSVQPFAKLRTGRELLLLPPVPAMGPWRRPIDTQAQKLDAP